MIRNIQLNHGGKYVCMVDTDVDSLSTAAILVVKGEEEEAEENRWTDFVPRFDNEKRPRGFISLLFARVGKMKPSGAKTKQDVPSNWSPAVSSCLPPPGRARVQTHTGARAHP